MGPVDSPPYDKTKLPLLGSVICSSGVLPDDIVPVSPPAKVAVSGPVMVHG